MSQAEVYAWLEKLRKNGDHEYYSITRIAILMDKPRTQIDRNVSKLRYHGFLDSKERFQCRGVLYRLRMKTKP